MSFERKIDEVREYIKAFNADGKSMFVSSSFQTHSIPLLHILSEIDASIPVVFTQTGFHFPETLRFKDEVLSAFGLELKSIQSSIPKIQQRDAAGFFHYVGDPDYCCALNKTAPMQQMLVEHDVWINGVRRDQNANRKEMRTIQKTPHRAVRYHPMLEWTKQEVFQYIKENNLPSHPLDAQGYDSIGCAPCTRKPSLDDRDGRWFGSQKTECGLHTELVSS